MRTVSLRRLALKLGLGALGACVVLVAAAWMALRWPRPLPPEQEQDAIYSAAVASVAKFERGTAFLVERPGTEETLADAYLEESNTEERHGSAEGPSVVETAFSWLSPPNALGYAHSLGEAVGKGIQRADGHQADQTLALSRIAFDRTRTLATVWVELTWKKPYPFTSGLQIFFVRHVDGRWEITGRRRLWIS